MKKDDEARELEAKAAKVYLVFNATFFDPQRGIYTDGEGSNHASLHANMFPLAFGLVPAEQQAKVAEFVQSRGMACSVYGAHFLLEALYQSGKSDYTLGLMTARTERSWWHMMEQGSTMTLEAWNAKVKPNLTWNHAWGAAPSNIISRFVLGVHPLEPGYTSIVIAPQPGPLKSIRGKVPTPLGPVTLALQNDARIRLEIEVPPGATARVEFPGRATRTEPISVDGKTVTAKLENGTLVVEPLPPGRHVFLRLPATR